MQAKTVVVRLSQKDRALIESLVLAILGAPRREPARASAKEQRSVAAPRWSPGQKRPPAELAALVERLAAHIKANPGQRIEQIGAAISMQTKDLILPIRKLTKSGRVVSRGQKRATTYYPAGQRRAPLDAFGLDWDPRFEQ